MTLHENEPVAERDRSIDRLALIGVVLCLSLIIGGAAALVWHLADHGRFWELAARMTNGAPMQQRHAAWLAGAASLSVVYLSFCWALCEAIGFFRSFARGQRFGIHLPRRFYRLAWAVMTFAMVSVLGRTVFGLSVTWFNRPGQRQLVFDLSGGDMAALIAGVLLLLLAKLIVLAQQSESELRGFV
jgi:hypothetical protein